MFKYKAVLLIRGNCSICSTEFAVETILHVRKPEMGDKELGEMFTYYLTQAEIKLIKATCPTCKVRNTKREQPINFDWYAKR